MRWRPHIHPIGSPWLEVQHGAALSAHRPRRWRQMGGDPAVAQHVRAKGVYLTLILIESWPLSLMEAWLRNTGECAPGVASTRLA